LGAEAGGGGRRESDQEAISNGPGCGAVTNQEVGQWRNYTQNRRLVNYI